MEQPKRYSVLQLQPTCRVSKPLSVSHKQAMAEESSPQLDIEAERAQRKQEYNRDRLAAKRGLDPNRKIIHRTCLKDLSQEEQEAHRKRVKAENNKRRSQKTKTPKSEGKKRKRENLSPKKTNKTAEQLETAPSNHVQAVNTQVVVPDSQEGTFDEAQNDENRDDEISVEDNDDNDVSRGSSGDMSQHREDAAEQSFADDCMT